MASAQRSTGAATLADRERALAILTNEPEESFVVVEIRPGDVPTATRIVMTIDPTVSPNEVARLYRAARADVLDVRYRSMTVKHVRLATFAAEHPEHVSWRDLFDAWNREAEGENAAWMYANHHNFKRDCQEARLKILNPPVR